MFSIWKDTGEELQYEDREGDPKYVAKKWISVILYQGFTSLENSILAGSAR